jgi:hypothetical protein
MNYLTEKQRRTLRAVIRGAQLRRANAENDLLWSVADTLSPRDKLAEDIMELSRGCYAAAHADEGSEELAAWNDLWSRTVRACKRRVC